jgi:predicted sulfurtransferase
VQKPKPKGYRTSAVETFPYYACGNKDSENHICFVFDNRYIVHIDLGNKWAAHCPKVACNDMDTGEPILKPRRMTETKLAIFLGEVACKKNPRMNKEKVA